MKLKKERKQIQQFYIEKQLHGKIAEKAQKNERSIVAQIRVDLKEIYE